MMSLADKLRPYVEFIEKSAKHGNKKALRIISLYQMHSQCPSDPAAAGLCRAAFSEWLMDQKRVMDEP